MKNFINYIFPFRCLNCNRILGHNTPPLCVNCLHNLPFIHERISMDSITVEPLKGNDNLIGAASLLKYQNGNSTQKLMHANKYFNQTHIGLFLAELSKPLLINIEVDVVICVPTHNRTKRERGYNQVMLFSKYIAEFLKVDFKPELIKRCKRRNSQTHRNKIERINALKNAFEVSDDISNYSKILLIDDVVTTGSTINVCLSSIAEKTNATVMVFTMAKAI